METVDPSITPRRARIILVAIVAIALSGAVSRPLLREVPRPNTPAQAQDLNLYEAVIERLHKGEPYYQVLGEELRSRHFPTVPVFNWRTPALFVALAWHPMMSRVLFVALGVLVLAASVKLLSTQPLLVVIAGACAQSGAIGVMLDRDLWVFHDTWTGYLIALSAFAYAYQRQTTGAVLGLAALLVRELAAPYALFCLALALRARRRREVLVWSVGLAFYATYYTWHASQVAAHRQPGDIAHAASWLQLGGVPFILATLRTNSWVTSAPTWITAAVFAVLCAGLLARQLPIHIRGTVLVYFAFFAVVGQPFDWYWGWIPGLLAPLVFAHGIPVLMALTSYAFHEGPNRRARLPTIPARPSHPKPGSDNAEGSR
jgi:hypothetical protein